MGREGSGAGERMCLRPEARTSIEEEDVGTGAKDLCFPIPVSSQILTLSQRPVPLNVTAVAHLDCHLRGCIITMETGQWAC